jgi:hypothetical protein
MLYFNLGTEFEESKQSNNTMFHARCGRATRYAFAKESTHFVGGETATLSVMRCDMRFINEGTGYTNHKVCRL